ncbi:MAG: hypothetical protein WCN81_01050, partial [Actinomycetes bacterium]
VEPPSGCHFHTRCPAARDGLCDVEDPQLKTVRPGHWAACHLITGDDYPRIRAGENDMAVVDDAPATDDAAGVPAGEGGETA